MIDPNEFAGLLHKPIDSPEVQNLCSRLTELDASEIEGTWYYEYQELGLCLQFEDNALSTVQFFGKGQDGYQQYPYALPQGITFSHTRSKVRQALGEPAVPGDEWDVYRYDTYAINVTYAKKGQKISLLTLMTLEAFEDIFE